MASKDYKYLTEAFYFICGHYNYVFIILTCRLLERNGQ